MRPRTDVAPHSRHKESVARTSFQWRLHQEKPMNNIIYIVGFVVIVLFVLGFLGLR